MAIRRSHSSPAKPGEFRSSVGVMLNVMLFCYLAWCLLCSDVAFCCVYFIQWLCSLSVAVVIVDVVVGGFHQPVLPSFMHKYTHILLLDHSH